jgi:hypothetical protein
MKYQVGDLVLVKACEFKLRFAPKYLRPHLHRRPELSNSFGIITQVFNHNDFWKGSTSDDNVYIWFSQLDAKEYNFCENEVTGEVIK